MRPRTGLLLGAVALAAAAAGGGYWFAMHRSMSHEPAAAAAPADPARKPLYWYDPMYPQQKFDKPGKSPFMDMELVPFYGNESGGDSSVAITSRLQQNLGIRIAEVTEGTLDDRLEAVGAVAFDERSAAVVQARVSGYVERLFARAPLETVMRGQPLAEILAPDWVAAQEEFLALRRSPAATEELRRAARQRLLLLGMAEETIARIETDGRARPRITLTAPVSGVVVELGAREGMAVAPGAMLFRINGLGTVWVNAEIPEARAGAVRVGGPVVATVPAYPEEKFAGRVSAILPEVNAATRTLKARIEIANPQARLKPGMFATIDFAAAKSAPVLLVPTEAVIRTGERDVVVVAETGEDGKQRFRSVPVELGAEAAGRTQIRKGLEKGARVVASGQFLIDSEASLRGGAARLGEPAEAKP